MWQIKCDLEQVCKCYLDKGGLENSYCQSQNRIRRHGTFKQNQLVLFFNFHAQCELGPLPLPASFYKNVCTVCTNKQKNTGLLLLWEHGKQMLELLDKDYDKIQMLLRNDRMIWFKCYSVISDFQKVGTTAVNTNPTAMEAKSRNMIAGNFQEPFEKVFKWLENVYGTFISQLITQNVYLQFFSCPQKRLELFALLIQFGSRVCLLRHEGGKVGRCEGNVLWKFLES